MDRAKDAVLTVGELLKRIKANNDERKILDRAIRIAWEIEAIDRPELNAKARLKRIIGPTLIDGQATPESKGGAR